MAVDPRKTLTLTTVHNLTEQTKRAFFRNGASPADIAGSGGSFSVEWIKPRSPGDKETVKAIIDDVRSNKEHAYNLPDAPSHDLAVQYMQDLYSLLNK